MPATNESTRGSVVWLTGGPSTGKTTLSRAVQRLGAVADGWYRTGDDHFVRRLAPGLVVTRPTPGGPPPPGWAIPVLDGRLTGPPRAGPLALRLLDGLYRSVAAMAAAGNNVLLDDVLWEPAVSRLGIAALAGAPRLLVVAVRCSPTVARAREEARGDRLPGAVDAYRASRTEPPTPDFVVDTDHTTPDDGARSILARWAGTGV